MAVATTTTSATATATCPVDFLIDLATETFPLTVRLTIAIVASVITLTMFALIAVTNPQAQVVLSNFFRSSQKDSDSFGTPWLLPIYCPLKY